MICVTTQQPLSGKFDKNPVTRISIELICNNINNCYDMQEKLSVLSINSLFNFV